MLFFSQNFKFFVLCVLKKVLPVQEHVLTRKSIIHISILNLYNLVWSVSDNFFFFDLDFYLVLKGAP